MLTSADSVPKPVRRSRFANWARSNMLWRSYRVGLLLFRTLYIINRERSRVVRARQRGDDLARPNVGALIGILREFRAAAIDLGGLLIKLGQFLGARADLLPQAALDVLGSLHDEVPPERFEDILNVLETELDAPWDAVFASIDPQSAGAASIGQVHVARLRDGRVVALKIQRPGIGRIIQTDLRTLRFVLDVVRRLAPGANQFIDLRQLYQEFNRTINEELDYQREGRNAERFARMFADDPMIGAPSVLWEYSTRRVLTLEWMDGIKITRFAELEAAGVDRDALARRLAGAYIRQVLEAGFFHADPHPGNLLVQPGPGSSARLVFVDFGMMGVITPKMRAGLRDMFLGAIQRDAHLVVRGADALGFLADKADREAVERVASKLLDRFAAMPAGELREMDPREVMDDVESVFYDNPLRIPAQFAFFGRAVSMLMGLTVTLSPSFNFAEVAAPYAQQFLGGSGIGALFKLLGVENPRELPMDILRETTALARTLSDIPRRLDRVLQSAERGELRIVITNPALDPEGALHPRRGSPLELLTRPVPAWAPLAAIGAGLAVWLVARRRRRGLLL
jgi:predicted unusual protein kinase regulating ubiquinone biosynthesis (AarF/ABC1/UbiB family)